MKLSTLHKIVTGHELFQIIQENNLRQGKQIALLCKVLSSRPQYKGRKDFYITAWTDKKGRKQLANPFWYADRFFLKDTFQVLSKISTDF